MIIVVELHLNDMTNAIDKEAKKQREEQKDAFEELLFSHLEHIWIDYEWRLRTGRIPLAEGMEIIQNVFTHFAAEQAASNGVDKALYISRVSESFDEALSTLDEEEEDEEEGEDNELANALNQEKPAIELPAPSPDIKEN